MLLRGVGRGACRLGLLGSSAGRRAYVAATLGWCLYLLEACSRCLWNMAGKGGREGLSAR